jgi:hypothetical protein
MFLLFGCFAPTVEKENQTITVFANESLYPVQNYSGLLLGTDYEKDTNYDLIKQRLFDLEVPFWRVGDGWGEPAYNFAVRDSNFPGKFNTSITYGFEDGFKVKYGYPFRVNTNETPCDSKKPTQKNFYCFENYEVLKELWSSYFDETLIKFIDQNKYSDFLEPVNEPNWGWEGLSQEQIFELIKIGHDKIRYYLPNANVVAPSTGIYDEKYISDFLDYSVDNNIKFEAFAWHELEDMRMPVSKEVYPEGVPTHVETVRSLLKEKLSCDFNCPEIHINEYGYATNHLIPGFVVGWIYYLNKAKVEQANRACWDVKTGALPGQKYLTCFDGFDGLFTKDDLDTQSIYYLYKLHAATKGDLLKSESTNIRTVSLSVLNEDKSKITLIVGRYAQDTVADVNVLIKKIPFNGSNAKLKIEKIQNTNNKTTVSLGPSLIKEENILIEDDLQVLLSDFESGDAFIVQIEKIN